MWANFNILPIFTRSLCFLSLPGSHSLWEPTPLLIMPIESSLQEIQRYLVTNPGEEEMQLLPPVWIMKNLDKNDQNGQG